MCRLPGQNCMQLGGKSSVKERMELKVAMVCIQWMMMMMMMIVLGAASVGMKVVCHCLEVDFFFFEMYLLLGGTYYSHGEVATKAG